MDPMIVAVLLVGALVGLAGMWFVISNRPDEHTQDVRAMKERSAKLRSALEADMQRHAHQFGLLDVVFGEDGRAAVGFADGPGAVVALVAHGEGEHARTRMVTLKKSELLGAEIVEDVWVDPGGKPGTASPVVREVGLRIFTTNPSEPCIYLCVLDTDKNVGGSSHREARRTVMRWVGRIKALRVAARTRPAKPAAPRGGGAGEIPLKAGAPVSMRRASNT